MEIRKNKLLFIHSRIGIRQLAYLRIRLHHEEHLYKVISLKGIRPALISFPLFCDSESWIGYHGLNF